MEDERGDTEEERVEGEGREEGEEEEGEQGGRGGEGGERASPSANT